MPEITSRDQVQAKLQEFDERLDGALAATKIIVRFQEDVAKFVESIQETQEVSSEIQWRLQHIQEEWEELKAGISETMEHTEESQQKLLERFDQTKAALEMRFNEAAQKLHQGNKES
ncbi:MAG: hypothetical protein A2511_13160 [Deltaproteobacteria bacterium RIFOXYD12_FULL_50_9]|nr:MAG: hypothetical protein A2511_13160 [Deltaproteobacteria bacterium RIFOXYD12_FULL_50_9]